MMGKGDNHRAIVTFFISIGIFLGTFFLSFHHDHDGVDGNLCLICSIDHHFSAVLQSSAITLIISPEFIDPIQCNGRVKSFFFAPLHLIRAPPFRPVIF